MLDLGSIEFSNAETAYNTAMKGESLRDGTRIARISRIIRLIRLIRIFKMYRHAHAFISYVQDPKYNTAEDTLKKKLKGDQEESQVGQKMSDLTTRRVLVLVILMLLCVPLFTINTYKEENAYFEYGLDLVESKTENMMSPVYIDLFESYIAEHKDIPMPAINVYIHGNSSIPKANRIYDKEGTDLDSFRSYELELVKTDKGGAVAVFDFTYTVRLTAGLSLARAIFVCCVLAFGAFFFSRDATFLIVKPIEGMISKVNRIAKNSLEAAIEEENEALAYERAMMKQKKKNKKLRKKNTDDEYETVKIEQTIIKIGALLAIGFGEAGAKIIADSIGNEGDNANSKVVAIFGFCDIRNFTDATEVLQEDVMLFVNEVANIVHGVVDRYSGAANKNIGDAFLLVWKFNSEDVEVNEGGELVTKRNGRNAQYADMSVMSFLKIIAEIRKSHKLERYSHNQKILEKLPNFQVKLGFGLHVGWAIEGAIGSDFKIDASYLSPNVNTASRLEAAKKQFGVPLLISGELRKICTPRTQANMRIIDIVTVKGSNEPTEMVTCDVESPQKTTKKRQDKKMKKVRGRIERNRYKQAAMSNQIQVSEKFELDEDIKIMRSPYSKEFFETFKKGFDQYIGGDWKKSAEYLNSIEGRLIAEDFPTMQILSYMKSLDFKAPMDWNGYRVLTEK
ncbi:unnamed protein product [Moneuplotes crassus]|uniref:Guanylate cyclase domain-containing protein n=1 Tax=Euplotes crassus TaxID=5936 RepID=A0AAD1Y7Z0_EUPCR|nr:unnamed protein product [Moneuplotes crassus]